MSGSGDELNVLSKVGDTILDPAKKFLNEVSGPLRAELGQALGAVVMPYRVQLQTWALFKAKEKLEAK